MQNADLSKLKALVSGLVRKSKLANHLKSVVLESDGTGDESEFLRVIIEVDTLSDVSDEEMEALTTAIENAIPNLDDRFPSIRFAEAA